MIKNSISAISYVYIGGGILRFIMINLNILPQSEFIVICIIIEDTFGDTALNSLQAVDVS